MRVGKETERYFMEWFTPCNPMQYDVIGAFSEMNRINWKQSNKNMCIGDIVYIYVSKPIASVLFKCKINKVNLPTAEINDCKYILDGTNFVNYGNYMELELLRRYMPNQISYSKLLELGLNGRIQSPRKVLSEISRYISSLEKL